MIKRMTRRMFNRMLGRTVVMTPLAPTVLAHANAEAASSVGPAMAPWPTQGDWAKLQVQVKGRLIQPTSPTLACQGSAGAGTSAACNAAMQSLTNPYVVEDSPGATQSTGWLNAWDVQISPYAVAAEHTDDIVAAVNFARERNVRLVVKGTGHDYLGRSNAADSLLVWTHAMRAVTSHNAFVPAGAPAGTAGVPAVTAQAGARWLDGYTEVTTKNGRYVQGGGCTSVGMAGGFTQGGGFGSFSRRYGTGAASMLEAEVVTADGIVRMCNAYQHKDLFWALCGGGAGTFGIVSSVTLMTHEAPTQSGIVRCTIKAASDEAYLMLLQEVAQFWHSTLCTEQWGEKISLGTDNSIEFMLVYSGMNQAGATEAFLPLVTWARRRASNCQVTFSTQDLPFRQAWDLPYFEKAAPDMVVADKRGGASEGQFWWAGDSGQVSRYIWEYFGRYMPAGLLDNAAQFADTMFAASRHWGIEVHINKGLFGANEEARARTRATSMGPQVLNAAGLFILAGGEQSVFPGLEGHLPDMAKAAAGKAKMAKAFAILKHATPGAGSYVNESSYFDKDWGELYWGKHYARLRDIKRAVDPTNLFTGHHLVGSEDGQS